MKDFSKLNLSLFSMLRLQHKRAYMLLENLGIHPTHPMALFFINKHNGLSQKELSDILKIKPASTTVMLQRMERVNLIKRCPDKKDQRVTRIFLTDIGKKELELELKAIQILDSDCFRYFNEQDKKEFLRLVNLVNKSLIECCGEDKPLNLSGKDQLDDKTT